MKAILPFRLICGSFVLCLSACVLPHRTSTTEGPRGYLENFSVDSIVPGETTRVEIERLYSALDTGAGSGTFFWGRYRRKWEVRYVGASVPRRGTPKPYSTTEEKWSGVSNVIVTFDPSGKVRRVLELPDSELVAELARLLQLEPLSKEPPPGVITIPCSWRQKDSPFYGTLEFGPDSFQILEMVSNRRIASGPNGSIAPLHMISCSEKPASRPVRICFEIEILQPLIQSGINVYMLEANPVTLKQLIRLAQSRGLSLFAGVVRK